MTKKYAKERTAKELAALPDSAIDTSGIPERDENFRKNAPVVMPEDRGKIRLVIPAPPNIID